MLSLLTVAISRCMWWSVSTPTAGCIFSTSGAGKPPPTSWVEAFCDLVAEWKPMGWAAETGQIRSGVGPFLTRRQRERRAYVRSRTFPTRGDKSVRAQSIRGRMGLDGLYVPTNKPWYPDFRAELLAFPAGKHDDCVDALGLGRPIARQDAGRPKAGRRHQTATARQISKASCGTATVNRRTV